MFNVFFIFFNITIVNYCVCKLVVCGFLFIEEVKYFVNGEVKINVFLYIELIGEVCVNFEWMFNVVLMFFFIKKNI